MKTMKFAMVISHDGEVYFSTINRLELEGRVAGFHEMDHGDMIVMSTDVNAT